MYISAGKALLEKSTNAHADRMALRRVLKGAARRALHPNDARIIGSFPMFSPASAGSAHDLAAVAIQAAEQVFPLLLSIASLNGKATSTTVPITCFADDENKRFAAANLKELPNHYGSDKARYHDYHLLYGSLLSEPTSVTALLEIGLGTNNPRMISNMGKRGLARRLTSGISGLPAEGTGLWRRHRPSDLVRGRPDHNILRGPDRSDLAYGSG